MTSGRRTSIRLAGLALGMIAVVALTGVTYEYDKLHRLTKVAYDDGAVIVYNYDAAGNRTVRITNTDPSKVYLAVRIDPSGPGVRVTRDPDMTWYPIGTEVVLTAHTGKCEFLGWSGDVPDGQEQDNPLTIVMDDYKSITLHVECPPISGEDAEGEVEPDDVRPKPPPP